MKGFLFATLLYAVSSTPALRPASDTVNSESVRLLKAPLPSWAPPPVINTTDHLTFGDKASRYVQKHHDGLIAGLIAFPASVAVATVVTAATPGTAGIIGGGAGGFTFALVKNEIEHNYARKRAGKPRPKTVKGKLGAFAKRINDTKIELAASTFGGAVGGYLGGKLGKVIDKVWVKHLKLKPTKMVEIGGGMGFRKPSSSAVSSMTGSSVEEMVVPAAVASTGEKLAEKAVLGTGIRSVSGTLGNGGVKMTQNIMVDGTTNRVTNAIGKVGTGVAKFGTRQKISAVARQGAQNFLTGLTPRLGGGATGAVSVNQGVDKDASVPQ